MQGAPLPAPSPELHHQDMVAAGAKNPLSLQQIIIAVAVHFLSVVSPQAASPWRLPPRGQFPQNFATVSVGVPPKSSSVPPRMAMGALQPLL